MAESIPRDTSRAGTARLSVVIPVVAAGVFFGYLLEYSLPLYFGARSMAAQARGGSYPPDAWSVLWKYQQTVWIVGPFLAGLLSRRYGERLVWGAALLAQAIVPLALLYDPEPALMPLLALLLGATGSLAWIAGFSLVQAVAPGRKGLANGLMMTVVGVSGLFGPLVGRAMLYGAELTALAARGDWAAAGSRWLKLSPMASTPGTAAFAPVFWLLAASSLVGGVAVGLWGQRPGHFAQAGAPGRGDTAADLRRLARNPTFWALALSLSLLAGPVFAVANQFLPYRAQDLGLISGAEDRGWLWLQLLKLVIWIPGGAAVGLLAGRRAPGVAGVIILAAFSLTALGIGASEVAWQLFTAVALFEFTRQFMRWGNAGYLSEHMSADLRATAIGCSVALAGVGGTIASWGADHLWSPADPGFQSSRPFFAAALVGLTGSLLLFVFDRVRPIRGPRAPEPAARPAEVARKGVPQT
jgi:MFS family permease